MGSSLAARTGDFIDTTEGQRLVWLWHTMIDHSSNVVYSPEHFAKLADDIEQAGQDLHALAQRGVIDAGIAAHLSDLFEMRYEYIRTWHYTMRSVIELSGIESTGNAARYLIELQLCVLRRPLIAKADRELATAARDNLTRQLLFLAHLDRFEEEADRRRAALKGREEAGEKVDWEQFEGEYVWRRSALVKAYEDRKLPAIRWVMDMMPYVLALTEAEPSPQRIEDGLGDHGS
ncbi:MAG: hypothetical protein JXA57_11125 [Armatimonadetes bacterium]|nr:hypothetical protein [Armatimonadota bacterium]